MPAYALVRVVKYHKMNDTVCRGDCIKCSQVMAAVLLWQFFCCLFQILTNGPSYFKGSLVLFCDSVYAHTNYNSSLIDFF